MGKLFGTDGVRGVAGKDLTCELALQIGRATAAELTSLDGHRPRILIGKDTRVSGDMLECTLAAGLCSVGADVDLLGVIPTPGVAYLVRGGERFWSRQEVRSAVVLLAVATWDRHCAVNGCGTPVHPAAPASIHG